MATKKRHDKHDYALVSAISPEFQWRVEEPVKSSQSVDGPVSEKRGQNMPSVVVWNVISR